MVIFHSYVSLPEGRLENSLGGSLLAIFQSGMLIWFDQSDQSYHESGNIPMGTGIATALERRINCERHARQHMFFSISMVKLIG